MARTVTYDGIRYEVLDLNQLRSGYQGSSSLTRSCLCPPDSMREPQDKSPHVGKRLTPEREQEVIRRLRIGEAGRVIIRECGVSWPTVRKLRSKLSADRKAIRTGRLPPNATPDHVVDQWQAWRDEGWTYRMIADKSNCWIQHVHRALQARAQRKEQAA